MYACVCIVYTCALIVYTCVYCVYVCVCVRACLTISNCHALGRLEGNPDFDMWLCLWRSLPSTSEAHIKGKAVCDDGLVLLRKSLDRVAQQKQDQQGWQDPV